LSGDLADHSAFLSRCHLLSNAHAGAPDALGPVRPDDQNGGSAVLSRAGDGIVVDDCIRRFFATGNLVAAWTVATDLQFGDLRLVPVSSKSDVSGRSLVFADGYLLHRTRRDSRV